MIKMKIFLIGLLVLLQALTATAAELKFSWSPNTESSLAGYAIHYGGESRKYDTTVDAGLPAIVDGKVVFSVNVKPGLKYFAATAYDVDGLHSEYSTEVKVNVPLDAPEGFVVSSASVTYNFIPAP